MAGILASELEEFARTVTGIAPARAAGKAMLDAHTEATRIYLPSLRMHNFRGAPVDFEAKVTPARATVYLSGGTYALADRGRRRKRRRPLRAKRKQALATPWGPRASVERPRWKGFNITKLHGDDSVDAGIEAAWATIRKGV